MKFGMTEFFFVVELEKVKRKEKRVVRSSGGIRDSVALKQKLPLN